MDYNTEQLLDLVARIVPNSYLQALLIIVVFAVLAKIVDIIMTRFLRRLLKKTRLTLDEQILEIFDRPIFVTIMLFGLALATDRLKLSQTVNFVTLSGLKTLAIFLWATAFGRFLKLIIVLISHDERRFKLIQERTRPLFNNLCMILVVALTLYFVLLAWNINVTAWMASAGILGLAISFAAKDTLANLFAGVFILADAPYKLGDFIVLDSGERGEVTHIGIRSTRLLTRDDVEITVPNSIMGNVKITNETGGPSERYRIRLKVGVAYGSDIDQVQSVLLDVAQSNPGVCKIPAPRVRFRAFGDSSLDHELLCWVEKPVLRGRVSHALNTEIYKRFLQEGIEIPFPQRDVHIKSAPVSSEAAA
ncbi:MAG: mechanosensitive ion channel family protein [Desulfobacterales bacterium]|nr:MAG: mechanosensitive ion channel family protein [Desulfobacterales bacterium]